MNVKFVYMNNPMQQMYRHIFGIVFSPDMLSPNPLITKTNEPIDFRFMITNKNDSGIDIRKL